MLTDQIRNILAVPEAFRAIPEKKKRKNSRRPDIPESLLQRKQQLEKVGIPAEILWDKLSQSHYLSYKQPETIPAWN
ncbi:hypothetical protein KO465_04460 [Candidatus Micrarchaeota archaeon]|jgi:hypothetical protein|nr:hypothetical protein [Candidatus Micrarchaeota archaeon]